MIGEILSTLNIIEKTGRFIDWVRKTQKPPPDSASSRFIELFESHDVHRNQIPRFFGHGLTVKDLQDETALLGKLDEPVLDAACSLFGVRREWLEGAESQVYPCHDFYKHPEDVAPFLTALREKNPDGGLDGILIAPTEKAGDALIILSEVIGGVGEKPIYRYHLCNNWLFDYWKSRAYLTAFVAIAWKHGVHIRGGSLPSKAIKRIAEGEALLVSEDGNALGRYGKLWYPEDMALKPDDYLAGVDPSGAARKSKCDLIVPVRWPHLRTDHATHFTAHFTCYACPQLVPGFPAAYGAGFDRRAWVRAAHQAPPLGRVLFVGGDPLAWSAAIAEGRAIEDVSEQGVVMHIARCDTIAAGDFILRMGVDDDLAR